MLEVMKGRIYVFVQYTSYLFVVASTYLYIRPRSALQGRGSFLPRQFFVTVIMHLP